MKFKFLVIKRFPCGSETEFKIVIKAGCKDAAKDMLRDLFDSSYGKILIEN